MLSFRQYIKEYLTPKQREEYSKVDMDDKAREGTDHYFGVGNDSVREELPDQREKSEVHLKLQDHLNREISHDEYRDNKVGNVKLTKLIKDKELLQDYNRDSTRRGAKAIKQPYMTIHRGVEVAGQTNPEPDPLHPAGHSWKNQSCKNIETGSNKRFLKTEVQHGTVIVFGHDHEGKEVYRAALQPHYGLLDRKPVYSVDSEYGTKTPAFMEHTRRVATKLSGDYRPGMFHKHSLVYNDSGIKDMLHPATPADKLEHMYHNHENYQEYDAPPIRELVLRSPNVPVHLVHKVIQDAKAPGEVSSALRHPSITPEHIDHIMSVGSKDMQLSALRHPTAVKAHHIDLALDHADQDVQTAALHHPRAVESHHITKALQHPNPLVRANAMVHPYAVTSEHITAAINDPNAMVGMTALNHPGVQAHHIQAALDSGKPGLMSRAQKLLDAGKNEQAD